MKDCKCLADDGLFKFEDDLSGSFVTSNTDTQVNMNMSTILPELFDLNHPKRDWGKEAHALRTRHNVVPTRLPLPQQPTNNCK